MPIQLHNNCYWTSLLRSGEKFYGLTGIFNYPNAMPSEGWVGWAEPKIAHNGDRNFKVAFSVSDFKILFGVELQMLETSFAHF